MSVYKIHYNSPITTMRTSTFHTSIPKCFHSLTERGSDGSWDLVNILEPCDVGRPVERIQEKMDDLGMSVSSSVGANLSVNGSITSSTAQGQPQRDQSQEGSKGDGKDDGKGCCKFTYM